jgi:hypothetical protein
MQWSDWSSDVCSSDLETRMQLFSVPYWCTAEMYAQKGGSGQKKKLKIKLYFKLTAHYFFN